MALETTRMDDGDETGGWYDFYLFRRFVILVVEL